MEASDLLISLIMSAYAWIFYRMNRRMDKLEESDKKHDESLTEIKVSLARIETDLKHLVEMRKNQTKQ